jgi:acetolactate synthase I/II/III large subunit
MNGAESLVSTAADAGVDICFANPGTTEMDLVRALDGQDRIRSVLGLFEGVCTAAADGYARMAERPALVLLHLGPGFANGIANLHNAARARTPLVCVVGEHATWHRDRGAPLATDIEGLARPVSAWVRTSRAAAEVGADTASALAAASSAPGVATLIVPADCAWEDGGAPATPRAPTPPARVPDEVVEAARRALGGAAPVGLFLGGAALGGRGLRAAGRIAAATGCRLFAETFPARWERGGDLPAPTRLPYFPDLATAALAGASRLLLAGASAPVAFFGYPGLPSDLAPPGMPVESLASPADDVVDALERLADALGAADGARPEPTPPRPDAPTGPLTPESAAAVIAVGQPEDAIVIDEGVTVSAPYVAAATHAAPHTYLGLTGGAIGQGLPSAAGAALARPDRPVLVLQADGSAMYTLQALWTHAREGLDVTTLVCANRNYRVLVEELRRAGVERPGAQARSLTDLGDPPLDWVALAHGMGVPGVRASTADELADALARSLGEPGPHVVEMLLEDPTR